MIQVIIAALSFLVALASVSWGFYSYFKSIKLNNFRTYTDKYNEIVRPELYKEWRDCLNGNKGLWEQYTPSMIAYLNLVWEEAYLANNGFIHRDLWKTWRELIEEVLVSDFAREIIEKYDYRDIVKEFQLSGKALSEKPTLNESQLSIGDECSSRGSV